MSGGARSSSGGSEVFDQVRAPFVADALERAHRAMLSSVLQCVAVCCSVLQCVAVCCGVQRSVVSGSAKVVRGGYD